MNSFSPLAITLLALTSISLARADDDAKLLQGKWRVVSAKQNGGNFFKAPIEKLLVVIGPEEIVMSVEGTKQEQGAKYTLDPKQAPKQITFTKSTRDHEWSDSLYQKLFQRYKWGTNGNLTPEAGNAEGIYKLEKDKLTICWRTTEGKEIIKGGKITEPQVRPTLFQSHLYYHQFLFVLERVKPE
jgi:uncharacterized protein (TIGR03067 family)